MEEVIESPRPGVLGLILSNAATTAAYFAVSVPVSTFFSALGVFPAPFWPGAAVALFAALLRGPLVWPGIFLGSFLANAVLFAPPLEVASAISLTNTLGPGIGALFMRRSFRPRPPALRLADISVLLSYGVLLHAFITGLGGATAEVALADVPAQAWPAIFVGWVLSDAAGVLLLMPVVLLLRLDRRPLDSRRWLELALISLLVLAAAAVLLVARDAGELEAGAAFFLLMPCTWLALRFPPREASTVFAIALLSLAAIVLAPSPVVASAVERVPLAGIAIIAGSLNVLFIGALIEERDEALHLATTDHLTGSASMRGFLERAGAELDAQAAGGAFLSVCVFEIDGFKAVNDTRGHAAGDYALPTLAMRARARLRPQDMLARLEGPVFAVLLPTTTEDAAIKFAERLRTLFGNAPVVANGERFLVTASFGVVESGDTDTSDILLERAYERLHDAKVAGGNRVVSA